MGFRMKNILMLVSAILLFSGLADVGATPVAENPFYVSEGPEMGQKIKVLDGGIERYRGSYYLSGWTSYGSAYKSIDLRHWSSSIDMRPDGPLPSWVDSPPGRFYFGELYYRYGASDLLFHNGVIFWVFNSMGMAHGNPSTLSTNPEFFHSFGEGSFDHPYSKGIDSQLFVAHDGQLLYIRKVGPYEKPLSNGTGEAWYWKRDSSFFEDIFAEEQAGIDMNTGKEVVIGERGRWETFNFHNFECPEMYYRNGRYYMLFSGNHLSPRTGLYETGVAEDSHYEELDDGDKYPGKLLTRNLEQLLLKWEPILPTTDHGLHDYLYVFTEPMGDWREPDFDDSSWTNGPGGFGYPQKESQSTPKIRGIANTTWGRSSGPDSVWIRRSFNLDSIPTRLVLRYHFEGGGTLAINGTILIDRTSDRSSQRGYKIIEIPSELLRVGSNVVAVQGVRTNMKYHHIDFGVYDTNGGPWVPDIVGPAQPNIIKGPNGFETWAVYKALWNNVNGQGKDRVFFWGDEMVVDGPSSSASPDLPLDAAQPTAQFDFDDDGDAVFFHLSPSVTIEEGAMKFNIGSNFAEAKIRSPRIRNVYIEAHIRFEENPGTLGLAGITAWYLNKHNWARVYLDRYEEQVVVMSMIDGQQQTDAFPLPDSFAFLDEDWRVADFGEQYHPLRIYKNAGKLFAEVGNYKVNEDQPIFENERMAQVPGRVGLCGLKSRHCFDEVTVTVGWEENDAFINGWSNGWTVSEAGIRSPDAGVCISVKGDKLSQHEFSAFVDTGSLPETGKAGLILEWVDETNYVFAYVNYGTGNFELIQVVGGQHTLVNSTSAARDVIYGHENHEGLSQASYDYDLRGEAKVSKSRILWFTGHYDYLKCYYGLPDPNSPDFGFESFDGSSWTALSFSYEDNSRGAYSNADFDTSIVTDKLRLKVPPISGIYYHRPFAFAVQEELSSQNFMRTVRQEGCLYFWVNGKLIFDAIDPFAGIPAKVGLFSENMEIRFDSITCFEVADADSLPWGGRINSLAIDLGNLGTYNYDGISLNWLTDLNPEQMLEWGDRLVVDFGANGLYVCEDDNTLTWLTNTPCVMMLVWGDYLVLYDGSSIYYHNGEAFTWLSGFAPVNMLVWRDYLVVYDDTDMYYHNTETWIWLTGAGPEEAFVWGDKLVMRTAQSMYYHDGDSWTWLTNAIPEQMIVYDGKLTVDFGTQGIYAHDGGSSWDRLTGANPENMIVWDNMLVGDFGSDDPAGIWQYDGSAIPWTRLTSADPEDMIIWDDVLVGDFGSDDPAGIWLYNRSSSIWDSITGADPERMLIWDDMLIGDFGSDSPAGIWIYNRFIWDQFLDDDPENIVKWSFSY